MKILNRSQIYRADQVTLAQQRISGLELMERAALAMADWIRIRVGNLNRPFTLFCGTGNNGGDGLALARLLRTEGYTNIQVYVVRISNTHSSEVEANLDQLGTVGLKPCFLDANSPLPSFGLREIVVDAIFGIGLNRPPAPWLAHLIRHINQGNVFRLSVDVPSGLFTEGLQVDVDTIIQADVVLSLGGPKLALYLPDFAHNCKSVEVLDIGWDKAFLAEVETEYLFIERTYAKAMYRPRARFSHKGTFGHVRVIGGSFGKIGAPILSAKAGLYAGSGLVSVWIPACGYASFQAALPEVMVGTSQTSDNVTDFPETDAQFTAVAGMGLGLHPETQAAFLFWLSKQTSPVVLDADALNILSRNPGALQEIPEDSVLTPHPGELERLLGPWKDDYEKLARAREFSERFRCVLVIKGASSFIIYQGKGYVNSTGNPGMATAGSGDILAGIIGGLLAQKYHPLQAAQLGVYLHGRTGDLAAAELGYESVTALGMIKFLGKAFMELYPDPIA